MKILFISHAAGRSGAPILLLHIMRWLKANTNHSLEILLLRGGPLEAEFLKVAEPARFTRPARMAHEAATARGMLKDLHPRLAPLKKSEVSLRAAYRLAARLYGAQSRNTHYDLIYANTAATGHVLKLLSRLRCPVLTHIHELEYALGLLDASWAAARRETDRYIAVSEAVKTNLQENYKVDAEKIDVVYGCVETQGEGPQRDAARRRVRAELGVADEAFVVGGSGTLEWRKAPDLFLQLANTLRADENMHFVWIGGDLSGAYAAQLRYDSEKLGLGDRVHLLGEKTNPHDYFAALDAFTLTSREDPFPLVCLEAAACGVPILCFDKAGGMSEFVEDDCGFTVPYLDVEAMTTCLRELSDDRKKGIAFGDVAQQKVRARHDIEVIGPQIAAVIEKMKKSGAID